MLVSNTNTNRCDMSIVQNGECCCNCKHRYTLFVDNIPLRFVCIINDEMMSLTIRESTGHGMCEMYQGVNDNKNFENLEIL